MWMDGVLIRHLFLRSLRDLGALCVNRILNAENAEISQRAAE
jgi:hypothetical protein